MDKSIKNKVAFVTGAALGIGRATAILLAKKGAKVMVSDINEEEGVKTTSIINDAGGYARFFKLDVSKKDDVQKVCETIHSTEGSLDLAVNNAGIAGGIGPIHEIPFEAWERMISICLSGVFYCMQEELKRMLPNGFGRIVNVSSLAGLNGLATAGDYVAAKHGVIGLTKTAALEYGAFNVRVNAVCPGFIQTAIMEDVSQEVQDYITQVRVPMKRIGTAKEVAEAIVWLLSDSSSYVNGDNLLLDGGFKAG
ncbi:MAG: NAD(P)-dependent dehydrogenase (short-subunit alcohol dehydrogenase family) [Gammaproteobacteria bacterium]|jgi:NAD(P)-dependent dehydrogenase (short-subunit alcohol dehydrogenase family)